IRETAQALQQEDAVALQKLGKRLTASADDYAAVVDFVLVHARDEPRKAYAGSVPYLMLAGLVHGGWQMARAAQICVGRDDAFARDKLQTALFYANHILPRTYALRVAVVEGADEVTALSA